jgi:hypothetical protein
MGFQRVDNSNVPGPHRQSAGGFAVVASEVKALAAQTAKATEEIGGPDHAAAVGDATVSLNDQSHQRDDRADLRDFHDDRGGCRRTTGGRYTGNRAQRPASRTGCTVQVGNSIADVSRGAAKTEEAAGQVHGLARSLSQQGSHLKLEVNKFLTTIRAA